MRKHKDKPLSEKKRRLVIAARQASNIGSLDVVLAQDTEDSMCDMVGDPRARLDDMYIRMVSLGAKMLERYRVRTVLMVMKEYMGLPRSQIARIYGCSVETVRKALISARETASGSREAVRHGQ